MTPLDEDDRPGYGTRKKYIFFLMYQTISLVNAVLCTQSAVEKGPIGHVLAYVVAHVIVGIPVLNMELVVSQFTGRDCIDVWKARGCVSHIGYFQILWQILNLMQTHVMNSFLLHYFLLSFEHPVPYSRCGHWSTEDCDILRFNYTVNLHCIRTRIVKQEYCQKLHESYPETQYWRNHMLGTLHPNNFHISWRVFLCSLLICVTLFLNCFKRFQSVRWCLGVLTLYPLFASAVLLTGSMMQKGVLMKYDEALDYGLTMFVQRGRLSAAVQQVMFGLGAGSGLICTVASVSDFRSPTYANSVLVATVSAAFTTLAIFSNVMAFCPFAYEHGIKTYLMMGAPVTIEFEKLPRVLTEYKYPIFWQMLVYSSYVTLGLGTEIVHLYAISQVFLNRSPRLARYPGLTCLTGCFLLFILTFPLLATPMNRYLFTLPRTENIMMTVPSFFTMLECLVFIGWYGLERLSEDVHFMQGYQPNNFMKIGWMLSPIIMSYVFVNEVYNRLKSSTDTAALVARCGVLTVPMLSLLLVLAKVAYAGYKQRFWEEIQLDPSWGPRSLLLRRSRALFTAQAMTKEYMYRQYHLQAGIVARQKRSNVRRAVR